MVSSLPGKGLIFFLNSDNSAHEHLSHQLHCQIYLVPWCIFLLFWEPFGAVLFPAGKENCLMNKTVQKQNQLLKLTSVILSGNNENLMTDRKMKRVDHTADYIHLFTDTMIFRLSTAGIFALFNSSTARHTAHTASG